MTATATPLRPATITKALKNAGFRQSEYLQSGRIRGWGNSTEGFEVEADKDIHYSQTYVMRRGRKYWPQRTEYTGKIFVSYQQSTNISATYKPELQARKMNELEAALKNMGYKVTRKQDGTGDERLIVERPEA